ncbi:MAG: hypothetical protein AAB788_03860 [Patescibacteria group bacterium]
MRGGGKKINKTDVDKNQTKVGNNEYENVNKKLEKVISFLFLPNSLDKK